MNIGIAAYFNPAEFRDYLNPGQDIPNVNPAATAVNTIALGLLENGHRLTVVTSYDGPQSELHIQGRRLNVFLVSNRSSLPKSELYDKLFMPRRLRHAIMRHMNDVDVIHTHWTYEFPTAAAPLAHKKPVFCTVRDWAPVIEKYLEGRERTWWRLINAPMARRVLSNRNIHFIANSEYIKHLINTQYPSDDCHVIYNPIKSCFVVTHRQTYPDDPVFVSVCQNVFESRKNIINLLRAFQLFRGTHPKARLKLIGLCNPANPMLQQWREANLLGNVDFPGFVNHDELMDTLDQASVLIHPSLEESFGNTLLEGIARRLPVIGGSHSGAIPYVLGQGRYGLLCDVLNPQALCQSMEEATHVDRMKSVMDAATRHLIEDMNETTIAQKHISLFQSCLRNGGLQ